MLWPTSGVASCRRHHRSTLVGVRVADVARREDVAADWCTTPTINPVNAGYIRRLLEGHIGGGLHPYSRPAPRLFTEVLAVSRMAHRVTSGVVGTDSKGASVFNRREIVPFMADVKQFSLFVQALCKYSLDRVDPVRPDNLTIHVPQCI